MEFSYPVTVCTPTYNRAYILGDLYHSLQRQTCMDFEWLIVDDGSADDTKALVASWQGVENPLPIRYVYQENGGKCRAINRGLKEADGRLFFTVDSDDYLTDDAIEKVIRWDGELPKDGHFCGYVGNRGTTPHPDPQPAVSRRLPGRNRSGSLRPGGRRACLRVLHGDSPEIPVPGISRGKVPDRGCYLGFNGSRRL